MIMRFAALGTVAAPSVDPTDALQATSTEFSIADCQFPNVQYWTLDVGRWAFNASTAAKIGSGFITIPCPPPNGASSTT